MRSGGGRRSPPTRSCCWRGWGDYNRARRRRCVLIQHSAFSVSPMTLRVYNTLAQQKELFQTVRPGKVGMYLCGPTVYKSPHVGHMVGPVIFDVVKRYLQFKGYEVTWVVNITDVDDKLIDAA